ncbi:hypothetical protein EDB85DRAFT_1100682 [Lactarius pseudohatsudake]|nr:hypothetical protein EDB85DRAFT_1100682 [Lactarius pseudohatsudake]
MTSPSKVLRTSFATLFSSSFVPGGTTLYAARSLLYLSSSFGFFPDGHLRSTFFVAEVDVDLHGHVGERVRALYQALRLLHPPSPYMYNTIYAHSYDITTITKALQSSAGCAATRLCNTIVALISLNCGRLSSGGSVISHSNEACQFRGH